MVQRKNLLQRLKDWVPSRIPPAQKRNLTPAEIKALDIKVGSRDMVSITIREKPGTINIKAAPDDFARLDAIAALIADGNRSEAMKKLSGVIYDDFVEKGLIKT